MAFFVVLSQQRSGTTWLKSMLNSHGQLRCDGEVMPLIHLDQTDDLEGRANKTWPILEREAARTARKMEKASTEDALRRRGHALAFGFKLMFSQVPSDSGVFGFVAALKYSKFYDWLRRWNVRLVLLERQGVGRYVSELQHLQTLRTATHAARDTWKCETQACVEASSSAANKVTVETAGLVEKLDREVETWSSMLVGVRNCCYSSMVHVDYDLLTRNPGPEMLRIYSLLGVSPKMPVVNRTLKMHRSLRGSIANVAEVEAALEKTRWKLPRE
jgi:LPS sulfotransferase NodH